MILISLFLYILSIFLIKKFSNCEKKYLYFHSSLFLFSILGLFLSKNLLLVFTFLEISIISVYFLISFCNKAGNFSLVKYYIYMKKFLFYNFLSSTLFLISVLGLSINYYNNFNYLSFYYDDIVKSHFYLNKNLEYFLMLSMLVSLLIKFPIFPFHSWYIKIYKISPNGNFLEVLNILTKVPFYLTLRFLIPFFPETSFCLSKLIFFLGGLNIFCNFLLAFYKSNLKDIILYANIAHTGYILISIYSRNEYSYIGMFIYLLTNILITSGMLIICNILQIKFNTLEIDKIFLNDKFDKILPYLSFLTLSSMNIPGTGNFIGELLIIYGLVINNYVISIFSAFGVVFSTIYNLRIIQYIFYNFKIFIKDKYNFKDFYLEFLILFLICFFILYLGIYPKAFIGYIYNYINFFLEEIN
ncbi:MAG: proton-conducting transporter membrane subunit [Enterobacteriaceae bacterium]